MDSAVISALISGFVSGVVGVVSVISAQKTAAKTVDAEIAKLKATWEHERAVADDRDFGDMVSAVTLFSQNDCCDYHRRAVEATAAVRAHATGDVAAAVEQLNTLLVRHMNNGGEIRAALENVLQKQKNK